MVLLKNTAFTATPSQDGNKKIKTSQRRIGSSFTFPNSNKTTGRGPTETASLLFTQSRRAGTEPQTHGTWQPIRELHQLLRIMGTVVDSDLMAT